MTAEIVVGIQMQMGNLVGNSQLISGQTRMNRAAQLPSARR
jgi:hypothetical protein